MRKNYWIGTLFMISTLMILAGTLMPSDSLPRNRWMLYDKVIHFLAFGGWSGLFYILRRHRKNVTRNVLAVIGYGSGFGLLIEILQYALPIRRSADIYDFIADVLGVITFTLLAAWLVEKIKE